ncbi:MAG: hypothetical protein WCH20_03850 [Nitrospira sp.]
MPSVAEREGEPAGRWQKRQQQRASVWERDRRRRRRLSQSPGLNLFFKVAREDRAADYRMNRDTTCRSSRPLLYPCNGEACTVRGSASLQASSEQGVVG